MSWFKRTHLYPESREALAGATVGAHRCTLPASVRAPHPLNEIPGGGGVLPPQCSFFSSISRVHAEIAIEKMVAWDPRSGAPASPSYVRVVDCSKYGTIVNKVHGTQGIRLHKDEGVMLSDGDTVTFGTGNATFRLSFVPIVAFFHGRKLTRIDPSLQAVMISIGAYATRKWSDECTHVLVDESCS
ncbi:nibrin homolog, partial [Phragmites australis]|uniref:nibrin homolog n=1 Tax=Phragmites australis TaxID=29695 RepID=UPI002D79243C